VEFRTTCNHLQYQSKAERKGEAGNAWTIAGLGWLESGNLTYLEQEGEPWILVKDFNTQKF